MLSKDLASPQIKNKMSKREFIRNTRQAVPTADSDFLGHLYDNIYVEGSIATWVTITADLEGVVVVGAGGGGGGSGGAPRRFVAPPSTNRPYHRVVGIADA